MKPQQQTPPTSTEYAIDELREIVAYFDRRNETINQRVKTIQDLMSIYNYERINNVSELSNDERLYHAEYMNYILGYKVYSTNQDEKNGQVSKPTADTKINPFIK